MLNSADGSEKSERSALNDTTIEERVTILEFQVSGLTEEVTDLGDEVDVIDGVIACDFHWSSYTRRKNYGT